MSNDEFVPTYPVLVSDCGRVSPFFCAVASEWHRMALNGPDFFVSGQVDSVLGFLPVMCVIPGWFSELC